MKELHATSVASTAAWRWDRHDGAAPARGRSQDSMIGQLVQARRWNQRGQTLDEDWGFEHEMCCAISERNTQLEHHLAILRERKPLV